MDKTLKILQKERQAEQLGSIAQLFAEIQQRAEEIESCAGEYARMDEKEFPRLSEESLLAAECILSHYLGRGDAQSALPYLLTALRQNSRYAAEMAEMLYTSGLVRLEEKDVLLYSALLEQAMYDKYYRFFCKLDPTAAATPAHLHIFTTAVRDSVIKALAQKKYPCVKLTAQQAFKGSGIKHYDKAYFVSVHFDETADFAGGYDKFGVYIFFVHAKKCAPDQAEREIAELFDRALADELDAFPTVAYDICGRESFKKRTVTDAEKKKSEFYKQDGGLKTERVGLAVERSQAGVLEGNECAFCGKAIPPADKQCPYCGAKAEDKPKSNSRLDRNGNLVLDIKESENDGELILLACTQCASPIKANAANGENVVCPSCGASFLLNKSALDLAHAGIKRAELEQAKPKNALLPNVCFAVRPLYNARLGITLPEAFTVMTPQIKAVKYPRGNPPELVLTDDTGAVNYTFSPQHGTAAPEDKMEQVSGQIINTFKKLMPTAKMGERGVFVSGGHRIAYFECVTPANEDIYNFMMHFNLSGTLMMASFNCLSRDRWFWSHVFKLAAQSMKFDD